MEMVKPMTFLRWQGREKNVRADEFWEWLVQKWAKTSMVIERIYYQSHPDYLTREKKKIGNQIEFIKGKLIYY